MDGEALVTLIGFIPGPDCLKELITKVGLRMKVYKLIKSLYNSESVSLNESTDNKLNTCNYILFRAVLILMFPVDLTMYLVALQIIRQAL